MRVFGFSLLALFLIVGVAWSQGTATPSGRASTTPSVTESGLPMFRPVLIGQGPSGLINRIDEQDLVRKGQKDALVMFLCAVTKDGGVEWSATYRGTPDSDFLKQELQKRISPASNPKFIPAVHDHQLVDAIYYGTVTFRVVNGKPRLRILSHRFAGGCRSCLRAGGRDPHGTGKRRAIHASGWAADVSSGVDRAGSKCADQSHRRAGVDQKRPEGCAGHVPVFTGFHYPPMESGRLQVDGKVELKMKVDATGNLQEINVVSEEPPLLGFGAAALKDFGDAKFIPAFRDGKPVESEVTLSVFYKAAGL